MFTCILYTDTLTHVHIATVRFNVLESSHTLFISMQSEVISGNGSKTNEEEGDAVHLRARVQ